MIKDFPVIEPPKLSWGQYVTDYLRGHDSFPSASSSSSSSRAAERESADAQEPAQTTSSSRSSRRLRHLPVEFYGLSSERPFTVEHKKQRHELNLSMGLTTLEDLVSRVRGKLRLNSNPKLEYFDPEKSDFIPLEDDLSVLTANVTRLRVMVA